MTYEVIQGDALTELPKLAARGERVSLVNADIPYFKVKGDEWDRQWKTPEDFLAWVDAMCAAIKPVLAPNGSLYLYASPQMARQVGRVVETHFNILNDIRWRKPEFSTKAEMFRKEDLRSYFPASETIFFCEQYGADSMARGEAGYAAKCDELRGFLFEPLRAYLDSERKRAGVSKAECNVACGFSPSPGGMASRHYFSRSQWWLPTREHYTALQRLFNMGHEQASYLSRDYEDLRRDYEDLRRPFNATPDQPYTDVWDFPTVADYPGKHPCEKPYAMMDHVVKVSSREGDACLDLCSGSGVFGEAAITNGRDVIAIERDEFWAHKTGERYSRASGEARMPPTVARAQRPAPLFDRAAS